MLVQSVEREQRRVLILALRDAMDALEEVFAVDVGLSEEFFRSWRREHGIRVGGGRAAPEAFQAMGDQSYSVK